MLLSVHHRGLVLGQTQDLPVLRGQVRVPQEQGCLPQELVRVTPQEQEPVLQRREEQEPLITVPCNLRRPCL